MSTVPQRLNDISAVPPASPARESFQNHLERLEQVEQEVISDLPNQTEDQIVDTRLRARLLGKTAWRIECACDAQFVERAEKVKSGRGNVDSNAIGVMAIVAKRAKQIGCTPITVYKNAQIHRLIEAAKVTTGNVFSEKTISDSLDEKGFFTVALSADNPIEAIQNFTQKKIEDSRFSVGDASRLLESTGSTRKLASLRAVNAARTADREQILSALREAKKKIQEEIIATFPDSELAERIFGSCLSDIDEELEEAFDEDAAKAFRLAWDRGFQTEAQLSKFTGFPLDVVSRVMGRLSAEGEFILVRRTDLSEDVRRWYKVGEAMPPEMRNVTPVQAQLPLDDNLYLDDEGTLYSESEIDDMVDFGDEDA